MSRVINPNLLRYYHTTARPLCESFIELGDYRYIGDLSMLEGLISQTMYGVFKIHYKLKLQPNPTIDVFITTNDLKSIRKRGVLSRLKSRFALISSRQWTLGFHINQRPFTHTARSIVNILLLAFQQGKSHYFEINRIIYGVRKNKVLKGVRIELKGRIGNSVKTKREAFSVGQISRNKIDQNIEYYSHHFVGKNGDIGVRAWLIYKT